MSVKALSHFTFYSKYSAIKSDYTKESWRESVARPFDMHRIKYAAKLLDNKELAAEIDFAETQQQKKRVLGSQRALQFAVEPILKHEFKMFNCAATHIDRLKVFSEIMYVLLCGCGVGFSVQQHHIARLPEFHLRGNRTLKYLIDDSIEGWADAIDVLLSSYANPDSTYFGSIIEFDGSAIRPRGALIANRYIAPGPDGLLQSLEKIRNLLDSFLHGTQNGSGFIRPIMAYDIVMHCSDSVLSGGVRRSATLCLFSHWDQEMITAKTGDWFYHNPQRARSNNSAALLKSSTTREEFQSLLSSTKEFGEPGFIWLDDRDIIYNPCCVAGDNKVLTTGGLFSVKDLVGKPFKAVVDNNSYASTSAGFYSTGIKKVYKLTTTTGHVVRITDDHRVLTQTRGWQKASDLNTDDVLTLGNPYYKIVPRFESLVFDCEEEVFDCTIPDISCFSANGLIVHNCEIGLYPITEDGRSGWETCNLTEINGRFCDSEENFYQACRASAIIGTLQAGYTNFRYVSPEAKEICDREALLGCSITGMQDNPHILLNPEIQRKGAEIIKQTNARIAAMLGLNASARTTTVKPAGSTSCLLSTGSGIHPHHARRYIRRVQVNNTEEIKSIFESVNPKSVEPSVWSANNTDSVISFLCEVPSGAIVKNQINALKLLEDVKLTQQNWVEYGTRQDRCAIPSIRHSVSNTIVVKSEEWDSVGDFIYENRNSFAGVSLLPESGDLDYPQAPFSAVLTPQEIVKEYGDASVFASGLIVDGLAVFDSNLWAACDYILGFRSREQLNNNQLDWLRRAEQFANRYFSSDYRKMTYCLKHVSLWKTWCDLSREYKHIDWSTIKWTENSRTRADTLGSQACSGSQCEVNLF